MTRIYANQHVSDQQRMLRKSQSQFTMRQAGAARETTMVALNDDMGGITEKCEVGSVITRIVRHETIDAVAPKIPNET